jgi:hypothetical protein
MNNKNNIPKRKRMTRQGRLQSAASWITEYSGSHIITGYANCFGVDKICAIKGLTLISWGLSKKFR